MIGPTWCGPEPGRGIGCPPAVASLDHRYLDAIDGWLRKLDDVLDSRGLDAGWSTVPFEAKASGQAIPAGKARRVTGR